MIGKAISEHRGVALVLTAFLILGAVYGMITPLFETPDEIQHYFHIKHIADGKGLPVLRPEGEAPYGQEGGQPSLYYLAGGLATFWIDTEDASDLLDYNPYVNLGVPGRLGNKNVILHTSRESYPYDGTALAVHIVRLVSVFFGGLTVLATYLIGGEVSPGRKAVALGAAVLTAFNPQFLFTSAAVNNDGLLTTLCSLALLFMILVVTRGPSLGRLLALAIVVGLAAVTKLTGVGLIVPAIVVLIFVARRHSVKEAVVGGVLLLGFGLVLAGWWYVRNWALYGDPTGMNVFFDALGGSPGRDLTLSRFVEELEGFRLSYWAVFGWFNVLAGQWVYRFFDVLAFLGILGLPVAAVRGLRKRDAVSFSSLLLMLVWMLVVAAGYVRYNQLIDAATGRLVFPAISCFSIVLAWGLVQLPPQRHGMTFIGLLAAAMLVVAAVCPFLYIAPAYARPPLLSEEGSAAIPHHMEVTYGEEMRLLGYELEGETFRPGELVYLTLYWQGLTRMESDYSVSLVLLTPGDELVGQEDSYPGLGSFPTSVWDPGDTVADRCWVRVRGRTETPTIARLGVSVYHLPTMEQLAPFEDGQRSDQILLEAIRVVPWEPQQYQISHPASYNLGGQINFLGHDPLRGKVLPGSIIPLTLYWQARQPVHEDYTVFTHLVDGTGRIWAQDDNYPLHGDYPTSFWGSGEVIRDEYELAVPPDAPAGEYEVEVGLYRMPSLERLPVLDDTGQVLDNRILLGSIVVTD